MIKLKPLQHKREAFDIKRKSDIRALQHSVTQYAIDTLAMPPGMPVGTSSVAKSVCQQAVTGTACTGLPVNGIDLSSLVPTYVVSIPIDPSMTGAVITGYKMYSDGNDFYPIAPFLGSNPAPSVTSGSTPQATTAIAQWKLDDATGLSASDTIGGYNGTLVNGPTWTTGILSGGLQYDGFNDEVDVAANNALSGFASFTLSAWVQPYSLKAVTIAGISDAYEIQLRTDGKVGFFAKSGSTPAISLSVLPINQWSHVALVYNGAGLSLYINGVLDTTVNVTGTVTASQNMLRIGAAGYQGKLDDVRLSSLALSAAEVQTLSQAGFAGSQVAYWKFDEATGTSASDASGNGRTMNLLNGVSWTTTSTPPLNLSNNSALSFDGVDDYGRVPYASSLNFNNPKGFSVALWAYLSNGSMPNGGLVSQMRSTYQGWMFYINPGNVVNTYFNNANYGTVTITTTGWHHLAMVWDGQYIRTYLDGTLAVASANTIPPSTSGNDIIVGAYYDNGADGGGLPPNRFNNKIDDLRLFNRPISAAEVKSLSNGNSLP